MPLWGRCCVLSLHLPSSWPKQVSPPPQRKTNCWCRASQSVSITLHQPVHCFLSSLSLHRGSDAVPPRHLPRTFIGETALLIKELIFSLLSLISIVNLKHCEFFKFSSLLSKKGEGEKKRWEWGIFNRLSSLPRELDFSLCPPPLPTNVKKSLLKAGPAQ